LRGGIPRRPRSVFEWRGRGAGNKKEKTLREQSFFFE